MKYIICIFFLCFGFNFQPDPTVEGQNNITQLNQENFNKLVIEQPEKKWAVMIQSPNCIHCQKFKPTYHKIAYDLQKTDVEFGEINCKQQKNLCSQLRINSYPQIWMMNNKQMYKFSLARSEDLVKRFIQKEWQTNQPKDIPDKMPTYKDSFIEGFKSFKEETQMVFSQEGNYLAKGIFMLIIFMILCIIGMSLYLCFQVLTFMKPVEYPEQTNENKIKRD